MNVLGRIAELWRYPVSSTGGERIADARIVNGGIPGDRLWGVVDLRDGEVAGPERRRHWRTLPNLPSRLGADGHPQLGDGQAGWHPAGSAEADAVLAAFLGFPAALRPHVPFEMRQDGHVAPRYARADLHLLTTASMRRLGELTSDPGEIDSRRFRPNVVVETDAGYEGFAEHALVGRTLAIGEVRIEISEPCARCAFTALAQGELAFRPEVLHAIARHGEGGFGVLCKVVRAGRVSVGDPVAISPA